MQPFCIRTQGNFANLCQIHSSFSTSFPFFLPLHSPPFCFLRYPWKCILSSPICSSVSSYNIIEGDKHYQSAFHKVHLRLCSNLVSTFCCTHMNIKSLGRTWQHLPSFPHLTASPRAGGHSSLGLISPEQEFLFRLMSLISLIFHLHWVAPL